MNFDEILPYLNDISNALIGRDLKFNQHRPYDDELDSLIETIGFNEFFKNSVLSVKIEFLSSCSLANFKSLIGIISSEDFVGLLISSSIDDLRKILKKLLVTEREISQNYWLIINENPDLLDSLDDNKKLLLIGYLNEFKKKRLELESKNSNSEKDKIIENYSNLIELYDKLKIDYAQTVSDLNAKKLELEERKNESIQDRIDKNLSAYVKSSVETLNGMETRLKKSAECWSTVSLIIISLGFFSGIVFSFFGYCYGPSFKELDWPELLIFSMRGIFIVSAFVAAAGFSFVKSNAFTHEAIIVSNRAHAIQFGQLYLEIYGNTVERSEMIKIFENWNISSETAFSKLRNEKADTAKLSELVETLKKVKELIPRNGKE